MIARVVPYIGKQSTGSNEGDARLVSKSIAELVEGLGHKSTLKMVSTNEMRFPLGIGVCADLRSTMFHLERKSRLLYTHWLVGRNILILRIVSRFPGLSSIIE